MISKVLTVGTAFLFLLLSDFAPAAPNILGKWEHLADYAGVGINGGPRVGNYRHLPVNRAARSRAETWSPGNQLQPERQCFPHSAVWVPFGPTPMHIYEEGDNRIMIRMTYNEVLRTIWMDGRAHPSKHALHTWNGFSTGEWIGETLRVTTTHTKEGFLRRNGVPNSDKAIVTEYLSLIEGFLVDVVVVTDPVYLTQPLIRTQEYSRLRDDVEVEPYTCESKWPLELGEPHHFTRHYLPGTNPFLQPNLAR